jgi:hypothetical protein
MLSLADGANFKPPSRSVTFDSSTKTDSIEEMKKQTSIMASSLKQNGSSTPMEHPQAAELIRSSVFFSADDPRVPANQVRGIASSSGSSY